MLRRILAALLILGSPSIPLLAEPAAKRNVLLICVDDLKPVLGCYGDPLAKSPNIDRLAASGVRFQRAYCNQAVCSPSRNSLLTGLRPQTLGIYDLPTNFRRARPDAVTLPQYFKNNGYRSEGLGKIFHVGHGNNEDAASWSVPHWRTNVVAYTLPENLAKTGLTREEALFGNQKVDVKKLPRGAPTENADVPDTAYPDGLVAEEAVRRLQAAAKDPSQPFFIAVGFVKPHLPFCAPQKYWDLYKPSDFELPKLTTPPQGAPEFAPTSWGELRQYSGIPQSGPLSEEQTRRLIHGYYAAMSYMDAQVGKLLETLDQTGLSKNTVVAFWGDHGWHLGDHGMWCKHTNYEQAAHIPLIVSSPGLTQGKATESLVETVDIYPTLCELAGLPAPEGLDGSSFAPVLKDVESKTKESIIHVYPRGPRIGRAIRTASHRLVEWKVPGQSVDTAVYELYDYTTDPDESKNVAAEQPEVVAQLKAILAKHPEAKPQLKVAAEQPKKNKAKKKAKKNS